MGAAPADVLLGPQPDADAEDRVLHVAFGRVPGREHPPPDAAFQLAEFYPRPLDEVMLEDPRLSSDPDTGNHEKVVMWSYPIIADGLIYVTDVRNGLYILKYRGPHARGRSAGSRSWRATRTRATRCASSRWARTAATAGDAEERAALAALSPRDAHSSIVCGFRWSTRSDRRGVSTRARYTTMPSAMALFSTPSDA
jgi:hypothetical protein